MWIYFLQIVHLKRFQLLHGRWVKSHKIVKFPFENFDPTDYLARVPKETILEAQRSKSKCAKNETSCSGFCQRTESAKQEHNHVDHNDNSYCANRVEPSSNQNDQSVPSQTKMDVDNLFSDECACDSRPNCNGIDNSSDSSETEVNSLKDFHQHRLSNSDPFSLKYKLYALAVSKFNSLIHS